MLPLFYQKHLKSQLSLAEYLFLKILVNILQSIKNVNLERLANGVPLPIKFESRRKRIQRFLSLPNLTIEKIWFPIIQEWLSIYFTKEKIIYVAIDRTNWNRINLFMVSVIWDKRAFPIYFKLLPKLGNSNISEQQQLLAKVMPLFQNYKVCVLGDREFCSVKLAKYLQSLGVYFCLRLKKNEFVEFEKDIFYELNSLGLAPGVSFFIKGVKVTKTRGFISFNVACKWKRKINGVSPKEGWFILTNFDSLELAIAAYKRRFDIEEMFRDFKKGGYNLEETNVTGERFISLVLLIAIAYSSATIQGQQIKRKGIQKYVSRIKEYGRTERRHSSFYIGLYGQTWVNFKEICMDMVMELMRLNRNKRKNYQQGLRAMRLIESVL
ncbi:IS4 family transposase [Sphaerospermopsis torques-reginae]|uniref:IS4 family transposase n=1 Tax=Sphaerospermopsis torques-reginae ITEP-024 TaxID=984208 RepID=A0ABX8X681_9CYAN|nr:IS4 family transposase [Sphaerospermopsis torques-reginae]QYX34022.1 IS4 family transposase [Sphaerospermopsis torques-reginae ITEP-024]QYX34170.1 IS4 family transposase [Sphaerospermopsis torques-reginae ITEP-024]QYX34208.1 IS4 family transposase [Sphaerospermopsis torques-reginae ITEP-024]QYX34229.1 IS4 family transposase [Sphaerospermopsis torques-reginae ITEP-024]